MSALLRDMVPASLLMAETRCPGVTLACMIVAGGNSVPAVGLTVVPGSTIATRHPAVDDVEPGVGQLDGKGFNTKGSR
jgi:hypothetical protein